MASAHQDDIRLAHVLADSVDQLTMSRFKSEDLTHELKDDNSIVTDADRAAEELIRAQLSRTRSRDQVIGEEFGSQGESNRKWIIDPIDGTANFARGVPVWATLIALEEDGEVVVGVVSAPALNRRWLAAVGAGAFTGPRLSAAQRLHVSSTEHLEQAVLSYGSLEGWARAGKLREFVNLLQRVERTRGFGDFWSYMLLAEGGIDAAIEPSLKLHDMAALVPIIGEAGGRFTDLDGTDGPYGASAIASNGPLHGAILEALQSSR